MTQLNFRVTDDSGFMALVDPNAYQGFVAENWDFGQLAARFRSEMQERRLLVWGTDMESVWRVQIDFQSVTATGFREITGGIVASGASLLLTNYESLSMAAQFERVTLPEAHQAALLIPVEPGAYHCRIIQMNDHEYSSQSASDRANSETDYILELIRDDRMEELWPTIGWSNPMIEQMSEMTIASISPEEIMAMLSRRD